MWESREPTWNWPAFTSWEPTSLNWNSRGEHSHKLKILQKFNPQPSQTSTYLSDDMPETTATGLPLADMFGGRNESNWLFHKVTKMFLTFSKRLWKFQGACGPEQLRVVNCNAVPKGETAHLGSDETVKYAAFQQLIPDVLHAILKCPKNGGCTELTKKDSWSSDGHLTNITNKQARKYFTFSDRYDFKICQKLTHWTRAKNITCETVWLFLKSTHLEHPRGRSIFLFNGFVFSNSLWGVRSIF